MLSLIEKIGLEGLNDQTLNDEDLELAMIESMEKESEFYDELEKGLELEYEAEVLGYVSKFAETAYEVIKEYGYCKAIAKLIDPDGYLSGKTLPAYESLSDVPTKDDMARIAEEAISDSIKKAWEKVKEWVKKVWEWIKGIFRKVIDMFRSKEKVIKDWIKRYEDVKGFKEDCIKDKKVKVMVIKGSESIKALDEIKKDVDSAIDIMISILQNVSSVEVSNSDKVKELVEKTNAEVEKIVALNEKLTGDKSIEEKELTLGNDDKVSIKKPNFKTFFKPETKEVELKDCKPEDIKTLLKSALEVIAKSKVLENASKAADKAVKMFEAAGSKITDDKEFKKFQKDVAVYKEALSILQKTVGALLKCANSITSDAVNVASTAYKCKE